MKKKLYLFIILSFVILSTQAQPQLWSMTQYSGAVWSGAIFNLNLNGSGYSTPYIFNGAKGAFPVASLVEASNGKLYGMTQQAGLHGAGVLFSFNRFTNTYDTLHNFVASVTQGPTGSLIEAANGKLYGMVPTGGANNVGVLFSYDTLSGAYDTLHNFTAATGEFPFGSLLQATDGKLYGMAYSGGDNFDGVIFSFDPLTNTYSNVFNFNAINGQGPYGSLVQAANGKLYGMTRTGGIYGKGNIFSFNTSDSSLVNIHNLNTADGNTPYGDLTEVSGLLYGLTTVGGTSNYGTLFSIDTLGNNFMVLANFDGALYGAHPYGSLFHASNGMLYGMTNEGGANNAGVIFSYTTQLNNLRNLNTTTDGNFPLYSNFIEINNSATNVNSMNETETGISINPNPASTSIIIYHKGHSSCLTDQQLMITNIFGEEVSKQTISDAETKIDVSQWRAGVYFYKFIGANENSTGKFLIVK